MSQTEYVYVGDIVNTHGLRGELRILSDSDFKTERFVKGKTLFILNKKHELVMEAEISNYRVHKNFDLLTFKDLASINDVEKFKGFIVAIKRESIEDIILDDAFYQHDIIVCDVYLADEKIGNVHKIVSMGSYDLWYIRRQGKKDLVIPFKDDFVEKIDIATKRIDINLLPGMDEY